jgi:hypothetical protein
MGLGGASLVLVCGKDKPFRTVLSARDNAAVRHLGTEYLARPRQERRCEGAPPVYEGLSSEAPALRYG